MNPKPIVTALLSYGMSGEVFHAPLIASHPGFLLHTVVQRTRTTARDRYPVKVTKSLDDALSHEDIELIIVNTPNNTHFDYASRALLAGKHVVVEKPFTVTTEEADKLIALAKEKKRMLTVFQSRRWDGDYQTLRKVIDNKWLGKIVEVEMHYDRFRNYIEANTWKEEGGEGTGILYNLGSHMLDQVLDLFGKPLELDARVGTQRPGGKIADFYDIRLQYNDFHVIVKSSYLVREQGPRYIVHGVNGSFVKYGVDPQEQLLKDGRMPNYAGWGTEDKSLWGKINTTIGGLSVQGAVETLPGNYLAFYQNVYDAIREDKPLAVRPEESRLGIQLIEACYESNEKRKAIRL